MAIKNRENQKNVQEKGKLSSPNCKPVKAKKLTFTTFSSQCSIKKKKTKSSPKLHPATTKESYKKKKKEALKV